VTFEPEDDVAYIYFRPDSDATLPIQILIEDDRLEAIIVLDVDTDGKLAGLEVVGARSLLPDELLRAALKS
jgi:uncharacterized protein YuzE